MIRVYTLWFTWIDLWSLEGKEGTYRRSMCNILSVQHVPESILIPLRGNRENFLEISIFEPIKVNKYIFRAS